MSALNRPLNKWPNTIEAGSVGAQKPLHSIHQVRLRTFQNQMKMIGYQAESMNLPLRLGANFAQARKKPVPIVIIDKNRLSTIPTVHDVVHRTCRLHSHLSSHGGLWAGIFESCQEG